MYTVLCVTIEIDSFMHTMLIAIILYVYNDSAFANKLPAWCILNFQSIVRRSL